MNKIWKAMKYAVVGMSMALGCFATAMAVCPDGHCKVFKVDKNSKVTECDSIESGKGCPSGKCPGVIYDLLKKKYS